MTEKLVKVEGGDTLSAIAHREMGDANKWPRLFARNKRVIIAEQERRNIGRVVKHVVPSDWIFPGTELVVPN